MGGNIGKLFITNAQSIISFMHNNANAPKRLAKSSDVLKGI